MRWYIALALLVLMSGGCDWRFPVGAPTMGPLDYSGWGPIFEPVKDPSGTWEVFTEDAKQELRIGELHAGFYPVEWDSHPGGVCWPVGNSYTIECPPPTLGYAGTRYRVELFATGLGLAECTEWVTDASGATVHTKPVYPLFIARKQ